MMDMDTDEAMDELMKMVPGQEEEGTVTANYYLGLTAAMGVVMWGFTAIVYHLFTPITDGVREVELVGVAGLVAVAWTVVYAARLLMARIGTKSEVQFGGPGALWLLTMVSALGATFAGFFMSSPLREGLMWLPWYGGFATAYLLTGMMVRRGGIYLLAGTLCSVGAAAGLGYLPVEGVGMTRPFPFPFVTLGILHVVPIAIDAKRGGRELTEKGIPAIKADELGEVTVGGQDPETGD